VVLVEQVKNIQGKVTSRKVDRILTPGTHVEAATASDLYITFVHIEEASSPWLALTAIDLTTGHLHVFETQAQGSEEAWTSNDSIQFMELYPPREVLWSVKGSKRFTDTLQESKLKNILGCPNGTTFHQRESLTSGAWLNPFFREDFLQTQCNLKSLLPTHTALHLSPGSRAETALLSLLNHPPHKIQDDKEYLISQLGNNNSKRRFLLEVAKCAVLCANCHRIKTHNPDKFKLLSSGW
jgi:hypothetical protein